MITKEQAREAVDQLKDNWKSMERGLLLIIATEAWKPLGYASFQELFEKEGLNQFRLSASVRAKAIEVMQYQAPELSNRQIAAVLGVNESTVRRTNMGAAFAAQNHEVLPQPETKPSKPRVKDKPTPVIEGETVKIHNCPGCRCQSS